MNAKKKRRLAFVAALLAAGAAVAGVIVYGLGQNTMYFRSPSDVADRMVGEGVAFSRVDVAAAAITAGMRVDELAQLDLAYSPPYGSLWDPLLIAAQAVLRNLSMC